MAWSCACHDLSEGGLAVAFAEMSFAGQLGAEMDIAAAQEASGLNAVELLFAESNSRFLIEVDASKQSEWEAYANVACVRLGSVTGSEQVVVRYRVKKCVSTSHGANCLTLGINHSIGRSGPTLRVGFCISTDAKRLRQTKETISTTPTHVSAVKQTAIVHRSLASVACWHNR